jgi:hypothetical protein
VTRRELSPLLRAPFCLLNNIHPSSIYSSIEFAFFPSVSIQIPSDEVNR